MPSTATKTKKPTIEQREGAVLKAQATLADYEADSLQVLEDMEELAQRRANVSTRELGKTDALKRLESLDRERQKLERALELSQTAEAEARADLETAQAELDEALEAEQEAHVKARADAYHQACLEFEDLLSKLAEARKAVVRTCRDLEVAEREAGHDSPWRDIEGRVDHRLMKRPGMRRMNPALLSVPAPPLAELTSEPGGDDAS